MTFYASTIGPLKKKTLVGENNAMAAVCPKCGRSMAGRSWHSYLGHLGLHGLADRHFAGDMEAAQRRLRENGLARQDPFPGNGAWPKYQAVQERGS